MLYITPVSLVLLVFTISAQTGAVPQSQATQNVMEQELNNILVSAAGKSSIPQVDQSQQTKQNLLGNVLASAAKKSTVSQGAQESDAQMSSILGALDKASSISQASHTDDVLNNILQSATAKSSVPVGMASKNIQSPGSVQTPLSKNVMMQPQALQAKSNIPFSNPTQQIPSNIMQMQVPLQKYSSIPLKPVEGQSESPTLTESNKVMGSNASVSANSTGSLQNATLSNSTKIVAQSNSSMVNSTSPQSNALSKPPQAAAPVAKEEEVMPHFKTKKEEAKWKMNKARKMLLQAKKTTEQALEYARERRVKVNKDNKKDVDEIIKKAEIALVHVGEHIGMEYKHYK